MLPPGRARLATNPCSSASDMRAITMGMVLVVSLAARMPWGPWTTRTSIWRRTNSAARSGGDRGVPLSSAPPGGYSVLRYSRGHAPLPEFVQAPLGGGIGLTAVAQETDLRDLRAWLRLGNKRRHKDAQGEDDEIPHGAEPYDRRSMSASRMPLITLDTADVGAQTILFALEVAERQSSARAAPRRRLQRLVGHHHGS
jgi:hypothetical protein